VWTTVRLMIVWLRPGRHDVIDCQFVGQPF
jgi:hypothetical protein